VFRSSCSQLPSRGVLKQLLKLPKKLVAIASPVRQSLRTPFHTLLSRVRQRKSLRVVALGQRLRHFVDHVAITAGTANGERVRRWLREKKAGWYAVLEDPQMPVTSTLLDQAHNAIERKLCMMKAFHLPGGSQQAFLGGLAHLYNLVAWQSSIDRLIRIDSPSRHEWWFEEKG
jgi:hypothetical protein